MPDLPHRDMDSPFLRVVDSRPTPAGDAMVLWDLRVSAPNLAHIPTDTLHSVEHFLLHGLRDASDQIISAAAWMCQTGFQIVAVNILDFDEMADLVAGVLAQVPDATTVPGANFDECGRADHHSLPKAQEAAKWLLARRHRWSQALLEPEPAPTAG